MVPSFEKFLYFLEKSLEYRFNVLVLTLYIIYKGSDPQQGVGAVSSKTTVLETKEQIQGT